MSFFHFDTNIYIEFQNIKFKHHMWYSPGRDINTINNFIIYYYRCNKNNNYTIHFISLSIEVSELRLIRFVKCSLASIRIVNSTLIIAFRLIFIFYLFPGTLLISLCTRSFLSYLFVDKSHIK